MDNTVPTSSTTVSSFVFASAARAASRAQSRDSSAGFSFFSANLCSRSSCLATAGRRRRCGFSWWQRREVLAERDRDVGRARRSIALDDLARSQRLLQVLDVGPAGIVVVLERRLGDTEGRSVADLVDLPTALHQ